MKIVNAIINFWDNSTQSQDGVEIHIPTPGIYRFVVPGAASYTEIPFSSIKFMTVTPQE